MTPVKVSNKQERIYCTRRAKRGENFFAISLDSGNECPARGEKFNE